MNIIDRIQDASKGFPIYKVREEKYRNKDPYGLNFRVSPTPFKLTGDDRIKIENIGKAVCDYMDSCIELYNTKGEVHELLDRGKPIEFRNVKDVRYLFLIPDLILTNNGFSICEIETSPFGLALAQILRDAYEEGGFNPAVSQGLLGNYIRANIGQIGTIAYRIF